jgi:excinuclease UvrABC helicase subunit UvrB
MFNRRKNLLDELFNEMDRMMGEPLFIKGKKNVESGTDDQGQWTKETFTSLDGSYSVTSIVRNYSLDNKTNDSEISKLKNKLQECIETQNFEEASKIRDKIKSIEGNNEKISELNTELDRAVKNQDFEKAIKLRDEINKLKQ